MAHGSREGFALYNIDKACTLYQYHHPRDVLFRRTKLNDISKLLAVPNLVPVSFTYGSVVVAKARCATSRLVSLPQELIDAVANELDNGVDLFSLAFTCGFFFRVLAVRLQDALKIDKAPWAGDRLVGLGASAKTDSMMSDEDLKRRAESSYRYGGSTNPRTRGALLRRLQSDTISPYAPSDIKYEHELKARLLAFLLRTSGDKNMVLRNLDAKQYVRAATLDAQYVTIALDDVIFANIQVNGDARAIPDRWASRGWAGHSFDITTLDAVRGGE